jgi:hypothetical protein
MLLCVLYRGGELVDGIKIALCVLRRKKTSTGFVPACTVMCCSALGAIDNIVFFAEFFFTDGTDFSLPKIHDCCLSKK